jgi:arylsulfatase A-like enzyme
LTAADKDYLVARYDASIRHTDMFIGKLVETLEKTGLANNTLLIIHSIHGEDLGERGTYVHYDLSEPVVKSALLVRFPGAQFGGRRIAEQVQGLDVVPTILDYLEIPPDHGMQGTSLLPLVRGDAGAQGSEFAYIDRIPLWEHTLSRWYLEFKNAQTNYPMAEREPVKNYGTMLRTAFPRESYPAGDIAIRTKKWKLIYRKDPRLLEKVSWYGYIAGRPLSFSAVELYDIVADPLEQHNLAAQRPEIAKTLQEKLLAWDAAVAARRARYGAGEKRFIIPYP